MFDNTLIVSLKSVEHHVFKEGNNPTLIDTYTKALAIASENVLAYIYLVEVYERLEEYKKAIAL